MEYLNDTILCLTYAELVPGIMLPDTYKKNKKRGNIVVHGFGGNGRKVFIEYESLPDKYKDAVKKKYGNPYEYLAKQPILDLIDWDLEAQKFYTDYVLPNGQPLPATATDAKGKPQINYVERYTKAASWLNMISHLTTDKRALKRALNLSVMDFWDTVCDLIVKQDVAIPANAKRLKEKVKKYASAADLTEKYGMLVEVNRFGNQRAAKIADEESEAVLFKLLSDPRQHDDTVIAAGYNFWAKQHGKPTVTPGTIGYFRRKNEHIIAPVRDGKKATYTKYTKEIQRKRADAPLLQINADDNCLDLFFEVERWNDGKRSVSKYYRPMLYVIIDTYNDYILGYAIGDKVTHELIYSAFRNALNHIAELTGSYYLPHQLQTDRWGLDVKMKNELGEFYKRIAKFTPQAHGVPQGKYIERSFGVEWHQVLKVLPSNNYAGKNFKAKETLSAEYIVEASKNYPNIEQMPAIVEGFINVMRKKANPKTGVSRQVEWLEAFKASEKSQKRQIDAGVKLQLTGVKRLGDGLKITSAGLKPVLNGQKISLDVPDMVIYEHNGKKADIYYDPENLNEVLVTGDGFRFVAGQYRKVPAALANYEQGDGERLHQLFEGKKRITELMSNTIHERMKALGDVNPQSLLQAGVLLKDVKNGAEAEYLESLYTQPAKAIPAAPKQIAETKPETTTDEIDIYDLY
ncbi:hypothetical protein FW774_17170 [Pedobacter sp. BS3]|uniref:hypothetical protein n=1 Tax=Pedobacter sp. BS3 TaxID=2567937 RepID=UPI0011EE815E|nr:hypothetical protein [Pedobacter sp. BS3]TZF81787.1 hypothetical protein FW774_17170 [Pedobacter sp. BS3]